MSELRWNAVLGEWTVTATHRQGRTFLPPADHCPLCPTSAGGEPTEIPRESFEMAVFENRFPSFQPNPPPPEVSSDPLAPVRPAFGACEVVVYTPRHDLALVDLGVAGVERLIRVWQDRSAQLAARPGIAFVMPFENKGIEVGVTLAHPHGQIYGYPFVPPRIAAELRNARAHRARTGRCVLCDTIAFERADARRIVSENDDWLGFVPFAARWPYETYVMARRHVPNLVALDPRERRALAQVVTDVLRMFDALFARPFPYILAVHQAPTDRATWADAHLHLEFYPPLRTATKLKYLAGSESGAGLFINDTLPEASAARMRAVRSS